MQLPDWASQTGFGDVPAVEIDAHAAYPAILDEYRALYSDEATLPPEWLTKDGELRKEWGDCLEDLGSEEPSAYWLEVAYQTAKLDVIMAARSFRLELRFVDPGKKFAQADRAPGRGPEKAAGGGSGGREARAHYRRLRGFLPA